MSIDNPNLVIIFSNLIIFIIQNSRNIRLRISQLSTLRLSKNLMSNKIEIACAKAKPSA